MAARRPASTNPFRKSAPDPFAAPLPSSPPSASVSAIFDHHHHHPPPPHHHGEPHHSIIRMSHVPADADGSSDGSRAKTEKRVRVQSPPSSPGSSGSSLSEPKEELEKDEPWPDQRSTNTITSTTNINVLSSPGRAPPPNPFSRTLHDMEQDGTQPHAGKQAQKTAKKQLDVDAFKRLLMTGVLGPSKVGDEDEEPSSHHQATPSSPPASAAISGHQPASTDSPPPPPPLADATPPPTKKPRPPPPPSRQSRHARLDSRDDAPSAALGKPAPSPSSIANSPRQRPRDVNRPLPPIPIPGIRPIPEVDVAVGSLPETVPLPMSPRSLPAKPPLPRKQFFKPEASTPTSTGVVAEEDDTAASPAASTMERCASVDSLGSRADSVRGSALAPAPPPPRRSATARKSISLSPASWASQQTSPSPTHSIAASASASEFDRASSSLSPSLLPPMTTATTPLPLSRRESAESVQSVGLAQHDPLVALSSPLPPPPPPARNPSVRSSRPTSARRETSTGTNKENTAPSAAPPPPPPPPPLPVRQRGGSRGSADGGGGGSGGAKRAGVDAEKQKTVSEGAADDGVGVSILADLEKLKSEVDAYRGTV